MMGNIYTLPDRRQRAIPEPGGTTRKRDATGDLSRVESITRDWGLF